MVVMMPGVTKSISIEDEIWEEAKKEAEKRNMVVSRVIEGLLRKWMDELKEEGKWVKLSAFRRAR